MILDLSPLDQAVHSLEDAITDSNDQKFMSSLTSSQNKLIIAGVIQNFEFTYELCWKFIKRWLTENIGKTQVDGVTRRELFRLAAKHKLIQSVDEWMLYHQARNQTSHTYDENTASEVFTVAQGVARHAKSLLSVLTEKND